MFYSASYGSMQFAIKKLLTAEYISICDEQIIGRRKKTYCITDSGKAHFYDWMLNSEIDIVHYEPNVLPKLFFLGHMIKNSQKRKIINNIIKAYNKQEQLLNQVRQNYILTCSTMSSYIYNYQLSTVDFSMAANKQAKKWYISLLNSIPEND